MNWYLYRLLPPRPDFAATMTDDEKAAMGRNAQYWTELLAAGRVLIFSPVADPAGDWGVGVVQAATRDDASALGGAGVTRRTMLRSADRIVDGPREPAYGRSTPATPRSAGHEAPPFAQ